MFIPTPNPAIIWYPYCAFISFSDKGKVESRANPTTWVAEAQITMYIGESLAFPTNIDDMIEPNGAAKVKGIRRNPALRAEALLTTWNR